MEQMYENCLRKMNEFVKKDCHKYKFFYETLDQANSIEHPNLKYFIYKSIILNNLYGVDIMNEAIEIAKLRIFLKLMSTVKVNNNKDNMGIEPLPDIDFNFKCGNSLVGFANEDELKVCLEADLQGLILNEEIIEKSDIVSKAFKRYKDIQLNGPDNFGDFEAAKNDLNNRLFEIRDILNTLCYNKNKSIQIIKNYQMTVKDIIYNEWKEYNKPFHWFAEFYNVLHYNNGFDIIIGNPPYVKTNKIKFNIPKDEYKTFAGKNLYSLIIEKSLKIISSKSYLSMITPVSICSGNGFKELSKILINQQTWISSFSNRPAKLFDKVEQRLTIFVMKNIKGQAYTSDYKHWYSVERQNLFMNFSFYKTLIINNIPLKIGNNISYSLNKKIICQPYSLSNIFGNSKKCWYHDGPTYWIRCLPFYPETNTSDKSNHYHDLMSNSEESANFLISVLISSTFYQFYKLISNCRDFNIENIYLFKIKKELIDFEEIILNYQNDIDKTSKKCLRHYHSGIIEYKEYYPSKVKGLIDQIDSVLAKYYQFTQKELDYLVSYDIKYRMGKESFADDTDED